jgi:hypothetical protein
MEELRSTEALDREILEDARKKAYKILKTAEDAQSAQTRTWDRKLKRAVDSLRKSYEEKKNKTRDELLARLPLDKRRLRAETAEKSLRKAMDGFLRGLPREKVLFILESELSGRFRFLSMEGKEEGAKALAGAGVFYSGLNDSEARLVLNRAFGPACSGWVLTEDRHHAEFPFIVINAPAMKITASVENAASDLLKDKRAELAAALLGGEALND